MLFSEDDFSHLAGVGVKVIDRTDLPGEWRFGARAYPDVKEVYKRKRAADINSFPSP